MTALRFLRFALLLSVWGCASSTRLEIRSQPSTNEGRTLYMLVREVPKGEEVVVEGYEQAAARVFTRESTTATRERWPIIPGTPLELDIDASGEGDLVLYFFFTKFGDDWWRTIDRKRLPAEIVIDLGPNEIERIRVRAR